MNRSLIFSILLLLLASYTHARNKPHPPSPSPVSSPNPGPGPSPNSDCGQVVFGMADCLTYLTPGSNETKPSKTCCDSIDSVLKFNPECICYGLKSSKDMGVVLDNNRSLNLPKACKLTIAPPKCGITIGGGSTPVSSPVSPSSGTHTSPSSSKSPTTSPTLAESPAVTSPSPSTSGTNNLSVPTLILVAVLVSSISYISAFF